MKLDLTLISIATFRSLGGVGGGAQANDKSAKTKPKCQNAKTKLKSAATLSPYSSQFVYT